MMRHVSDQRRSNTHLIFSGLAFSLLGERGPSPSLSSFHLFLDGLLGTLKLKRACLNSLSPNNWYNPVGTSDRSNRMTCFVSVILPLLYHALSHLASIGRPHKLPQRLLLRQLGENFSRNLVGSSIPKPFYMRHQTVRPVRGHWAPPSPKTTGEGAAIHVKLHERPTPPMWNLNYIGKNAPNSNPSIGSNYKATSIGLRFRKIP